MMLKTVKTALKLAAFVSFVCCAASCKQNLLSEPDLNKIARSSNGAEGAVVFDAGQVDWRTGDE